MPIRCEFVTRFERDRDRWYTAIRIEWHGAGNRQSQRLSMQHRRQRKQFLLFKRAIRRIMAPVERTGYQQEVSLFSQASTPGGCSGLGCR